MLLSSVIIRYASGILLSDAAMAHSGQACGGINLASRSPRQYDEDIIETKGESMRIILACAAGMSTSMLANNIKRVAEERGLDIEVEAMSTSALGEAQWRSADVVLVGPQMRHQLPTLAEKGAAFQVPVEAIPPQDYALANGQHVLEQAYTLVEQNAFQRDAGL